MQAFLCETMGGAELMVWGLNRDCMLLVLLLKVSGGLHAGSRGLFHLVLAGWMVFLS